MSKLGEQVLETALALPPDERAELAERLLCSLDMKRQLQIDALWAAEAEDRIDAFERGQINTVSLEEAFQTNQGSRR